MRSLSLFPCFTTEQQNNVKLNLMYEKLRSLFEISFIILDPVWKRSLLLGSLVAFPVLIKPGGEALRHFLDLVVGIDQLTTLVIHELTDHILDLIFSRQYWNHVTPTVRMPASPLEIFRIEASEIITYIWVWMVIAHLDLTANYKIKGLPAVVISRSVGDIRFCSG